MFFSTFANLLSSIPTFVFPVFASYKALKTTDPALLTPWLMYWVVLACALLAESWVGFILFWIPFYSWFRLFFLLYLILPQTQGARVLYQEHVHPFLEKNELAIDDFISSAHDRAKALGLLYLKQGIDLVKQAVFGIQPKEPTPPSTPTTFSYAQSLISRFNLPAARPTTATTSSANDFYSLLGSAVSAATTTASGKQTRDLSNSGVLIPPSVDGDDRLSFITAQRERLSILLSALDKEANTLQNKRLKSRGGMFDGAGSIEDDAERPRSSASVLSGMSTRKSEIDFEKIDIESGSEEVESQRRKARRSQSGSWMPWGWGAKAEASVDTVMTGQSEHDQGRSTGLEY
ncbi:TB2/DP1, HVA22 family-domain-containing protein [Calycina marina]|uniref:Protein YOP1 n=1 Tax=Calycina marina TaxID=1763456 RepID=A0A9P7Z4S3_9HELO|nr:TB2/DP1, HVA22 family-domain-containing protein [Calycina marina]